MVPMRTQEMPNLLDRMRLKDRILESISKAVKKIQELQFNSGHPDLVLTNNNWQFQKLVEHLDHALLHGLRHITNGYWVVVQEFTHKATVKEINRLTNVTTNLGRGRAWLYMALTDHLLESYVRCFSDHTKLVKKYYAKEAIVLDHQRLQILLTLSSGLEYVTFQLDADMAYLDLATYMRPAQAAQPEDREDRISLNSMDSSMSQSSLALPGSRHQSVSEYDSDASTGSGRNRRSLVRDYSGSLSGADSKDGDDQNPRSRIPSVEITHSSSEHSSLNFECCTASLQSSDTDYRNEVLNTESDDKENKLKRFSNITVETSNDFGSTDLDLEVIRIRTKTKYSKKKKVPTATLR